MSDPIEVFYRSDKGASIGRCFYNEAFLVHFISKLHKPANILFKGEHIGRVWKDNRKWVWFYDPEKIKAVYS